jgi:presenilin-like A22 family membrane protease
MTQVKDNGLSAAFPFVSMIGLFILIHGLALLMVRPFAVADVVVFENPNDPANLLFFFASIFVFTLVILLIAKFWKKQLIRGIVLGAVGYFAFDFFYFLSALLVPEMWALFLSIAAAAALVVALLRHPEWYVIDACCVIVGVGSVAIFGISLSVFLVIVLLIGLAIYDAMSVYKTKHMIDLADTILDLRLPLALVIPKMRKYSLIAEEKRLKEKLDAGE